MPGEVAQAVAGVGASPWFKPSTGSRVVIFRRAFAEHLAGE